MARTEPAADELERLIGTTAGGKYRVERLIGRGGMGAVFQATNTAIGKRVALKFLRREAASDPARAQRFQREAEAAGMIESEHIVHVFDSGTSDEGLPFLVMELLSGEDLRARLRREGQLELADAIEVTAQVLRALVRAHAAGIVHRDLKPDNVFLCRRDDGSLLVKLVDFGISKLLQGHGVERLTRRGTVLGSAHYMSPEQAQADDVDQRSDLFSVGAMLFEMLTGLPPHQAPTLEGVLVAICTEDAPDVGSLRSDVPIELADAVARALAKNREQRFPSANEFLEALTRRGGLAGMRRRRRRIPGTLVAGTLATLLGFTLTAAFVARRTNPSSPPPSSGTELGESAPPGAPAAISPPAATSAAPATSAADPAKPPPSLEPAAIGSIASPSRPRSSAGERARVPAAGRTKPVAPRDGGIANSLQLSTREP